MPTRKSSQWLTEEVADFLASCPTGEELLAFRPSAKVQSRLADLQSRSKQGALNEDEQWELDQFEHIEMLMQLVKARLRPRKRTPA
jgi:hypothetical protein